MDPAQVTTSNGIVAKFQALKARILAIAADWQDQALVFATTLASQFGLIGVHNISRQTVIAAIVTAAHRWFTASVPTKP